jgi:putative copper export protein
MFLTPDSAQIVLWLHILAATVWIGGQITIAALLPLLRGRPELLAAGARRFQWIAWIAFGVLVLTGIWNVHNAGITLHDTSADAVGRTLVLKLGLVALSGMAAALHALVVAPRVATSTGRAPRLASAGLGALSLLAALLAALYGVVIAEQK